MVTILIPTFNRGAFVARALGYYASVRCPFGIIVADSSDDENFRLTQDAIRKSANHLNVDHQRFSDQFSNYQCLHEALKHVATPHVAVIGDDDLLVPGALGEAAHFLSAHPEYSGVVGEAVTVRTENDAVIGKIVETGPYATAPRAEEHAEDRLLKYMNHGDSIDYALMRLEDRRKNVEIAVMGGLYRKFGFFGELANAMLTLAGGKIHKLGRLMLMRQVHRGASVFEFRLDIFDRICESDWHLAVVSLRTNIEKHLVGRAAMTEEAAHRLAKAVVWSYVDRISSKDLSRFMAREWPGERMTATTSGRRLLRSALVKLGVSRQFSARWRPRSIEGLSHRGSPFYDDFAAIRASIESPVI